MINWYRFILLFGLLSICSSGVVTAQDADKKRTRAKLEFLKKADNSEYLLGNIKVREDRYLPLEGAVISFYGVGDTTMVHLGDVETDANGDAFLLLEDLEGVYKDEEGFMTFEAIYDGSELTEEESAEVTVKRANLELSFFQKDSVKRINIDAFEIGEDDEIIPIEDLEVLFYIEGTFSLLNFAEETTDAEGNITIDFPVDMPGDTAGVLTIITKVVESDDYGTIEAQEPINWGTPIVIEKVTRRGLGDTDAPLWMVYTLIILLSAVWFHYFYVIYLIVKIKLARRVFT